MTPKRIGDLTSQCGTSRTIDRRGPAVRAKTSAALTQLGERVRSASQLKKPLTAITEIGAAIPDLDVDGSV